MFKGPNEEKRPADAIGLAVMIGKIATGKIEDTREASSASAQLGSLGGKMRAANITPERRAGSPTRVQGSDGTPRSIP